MGQAEIRVGLNTANFGNLELHTSVNQDRVTATLATSHSELRAALAAEMPTLEHAMTQHHLTLDSFHLDTRSEAQDNNHGASGHQQDRPQTWTEPAAGPAGASDSLPTPETAPPQLWIRPYSSGLNVHA
jgi:flagellar hook-length control protein FliK